MSRLLNSAGRETLVLPAPKRLRSLPNLPSPNRICELSVGHSSGHSAAGSDAGVDELIASDQGDLITGMIGLSIEKAHAINASRDDPDMAKDVADYLEETLRIVYPIPTAEKFSLEYPSNLFLCLRDYHQQFDVYATFAITGTIAALNEIATILRLANDRLQSNIDSGRAFKWRSMGERRIDFEKLQEVTEFELVLLHPNHFSPFGCPVIYKVDDTYAFAYVKDGVLQGHDGSPYTLPHPPQRPEPEEQLNILFLILNAFEKFRYHQMLYGFDNLSSDTLQKIKKTNEVVDLILFKPEYGREQHHTSLLGKRRIDYEHDEDSTSRQHAKLSMDDGSGSGESEYALKSSEELKEATEEATEATENEDIFWKLEHSNDIEERQDLLYMMLSRGYRKPSLPGIPDPRSLFDEVGEGED